MDIINLLKSKTTIDPITSCWLYKPYTAEGYGYIVIDSKYYTVHRLSASIYHNLDLNNKSLMACHKDDLCNHRNCWNPDHLYIGDACDNVRDAVKKGTHAPYNRNKTHCVNGHEFTSENTYNRIKWGKPIRDCIACKKFRAKKKNKKKYRN